MNRQDGMPSCLRCDYSTLFHQDLGREQPALAVLVVDQWQPALVRRRSFFAPACMVGVENLSDPIRIAAPCHRSSRASIKVRKEGDRLLAVPGSLDGLAAKLDHLAQLGCSLAHLDLEVTDIRDLLRHPDEKSSRQRRATHGRILDHDREIDRVRYAPEEIVNCQLRRTDCGPMIRWHDHHHGSPSRLCSPAALCAHTRAEMGGGDDHWDPPSNVLEGEVGQPLALLVAEHELLREVGQDAEAVRAGVDHEVEAASLAIEVQFTIIPERGGHNREHALEPRCNRLAHANLPRACCYVPVALQPNVWPDMSAAYSSPLTKSLLRDQPTT